MTGNTVQKHVWQICCYKLRWNLW